MATTEGFDAGKLAPSLYGIEPVYRTPDESAYFATGEEIPKENRALGLNNGQVAELLDRARKAYDRASSFWDRNYRDMEEDMRMYAARDMWTEEARVARAGRPVLQFPILKKFVKRTVADAMKNPPGVKISPRRDSEARKAEVGMGIVRYVEDRSNAQSAYTKGYTDAAVCGLGWFRVTFSAKRREIEVKKVSDPLYYMLDPDSENADGSDANFVVSRSEKVRHDEHVSCYEYWWREKSDTPDAEWEVYWAVLEGCEVKDYGRFPGEIIPVIPVMGEVVRWKDEVVVKGIVRDLIDAQKTYNYLKSQEVEIIALTPKSPLMAEEGTIPKEYEKDWTNYTRNPTKILKYRSTNLRGEPTQNKPEFLSMSSDTTWAGRAAQESVADLKEITGIYDTALGSDRTELSGKAIIAKQVTADAGQYTFTDNLRLSVKRAGQCIVGLIPYVMEGERIVRILGEDGTYSSVDLDRPYGEMGGDVQEPMDLDFSEMDVSISSGNSFGTRREQALSMFQDMMQAMPETATVIADLVVKNMDFDDAAEASRRLHAMLPPQVLALDKYPQGYVPQSQLMQAVEMFEQAKKQNMELVAQKDAYIASLEAELKNQFQSRIAAEQIKGQYKLADTEMKEAGENARKALEIQQKTDAKAADLQAQVFKDISDRAAKASEKAVVVVDSSAPAQNLEMQSDQQAPVLPVEFRKPTVAEGPMSTEDMLMEL
jgi:tetratricopeptide (TPR) repeat protein